MEQERRAPTEYEKLLMEYLGFRTLPELLEFLNRPSWGCPTMQPPEENV
jgi:hypothetical protein